MRSNGSPIGAASPVGFTAGAYGFGSALTIIPIANMIAGWRLPRAAFFWYGLVQGIIIMLASLALRAPRAGETQASATIVQKPA